ncbi:hypothetical protein DP939_14330 [Spongiactinospora rosea]|uniref:Transposase IS4-like domain-containing protein n=1 Tax=Spongiactinospora rosea TaxID=2248750 RepID=A0A366LYY3_9ACTN|nr:hypothetical protein [Spongiactinospora rosea]RBQ19131.1 hypothetical protein DP939_14330 [Spongiactinospora rosea]
MSHKPSELAFFLCHTTTPVPLHRLVKVAGLRWSIEECFQAGKNETGMDHYQVRLYPAWYRYMTLTMLALAFLAVTRASLLDEPLSAPADPARRLIPVSANESCRLVAVLTRPPVQQRQVQRWSLWRRRHQTRARQSHYQRQRNKDPDLRLEY